MAIFLMALSLMLLTRTIGLSDYLSTMEILNTFWTETSGGERRSVLIMRQLREMCRRLLPELYSIVEKYRKSSV